MVAGSIWSLKYKFLLAEITWRLLRDSTSVSVGWVVSPFESCVNGKRTNRGVRFQIRNSHLGWYHPCLQK